MLAMEEIDMDRNSSLDNLVFGDAEYDKERRERQRRRRLARMEEKIERERRVRRTERRKRITVAVICCLSIILALSALVFVVNHADEFENIKGAEAAGLNDKTTADADYIDGEDSAVTDDSWKVILVNKDHPVPDGYSTEFTDLSNGQQVDSRMYPDLQMMFDDLRSEGYKPVVASGYRTEEYQETLLADKEAELIAEGYTEADAETEAKSWIAEPGTSEHHTGLAVDINSEATPGTADPSEVSEPLYQWLEDNSYRYGFILRYPPGKEDITGVNYEPWHYRYVGVENAEQIHEDGLTLEEYLEK